MSHVALRHHLAVFNDLLSDDEVTEIIVNRPNEIWIEKNGTFDVIPRPLSFTDLMGLAELVATYSGQVLNNQHPLLSATLPDGSRAQFIIPAACPAEHVYIVIRRHRMIDLTLEDYVQSGIFDPVNEPEFQQSHYAAIRPLQEAYDVSSVIRYCMQHRVSLLISGATGTGKTALLNTCLKYMPITDRLVSIEDTREVQPPHKNAMFLLFSRGGQGVSSVTPRELLEATLRLRPDRIIFQELRSGAEAEAFLRAINSGHHGSIATVHANSAGLAYEQIALMVMQAGLGLTMEQIVEYVKRLMPVALQYKFLNGKRRITEICVHEKL